MSDNNDFQQLKDMTKFIVNPIIKKFVDDFLDEHMPEYFAHIPASSSGKFHPSYALGEGGLCRHVIAATRFIIHITALEYLQIDSLMRDKMIAATILHDSYKQGLSDVGCDYTTKDHPRAAAHEIEKYASDVNALDPDRPSIARLVSTHMGQWTPKSKPGNRYEFLVHLADYLASRKDISIDFGEPIERR